MYLRARWKADSSRETKKPSDRFSDFSVFQFVRRLPITSLFVIPKIYENYPSDQRFKPKYNSSIGRGCVNRTRQNGGFLLFPSHDFVRNRRNIHSYSFSKDHINHVKRSIVSVTTKGLDNLRGFYFATRYQILRVVPFADPPPFFVFYHQFAGPSARMRVGDSIRSQARRASLAPVWLPSTRGLIPRETTGSGRCICAKRVQRVSSGSGRSGAEWRGANGAAGSGGNRGGASGGREVHGAPRFAWPQSSLSRAKAAGAPPH